jgi:hydroxylaminobenzene mutase
MFHGMCLFVLGLITGFAEQHFANARLGLAAHLEGVMNGIFLLALGAAWNQVKLPIGALKIAFWAVLYGTYINWFITMLAAAFGTAALSPITGAGHSGLAWQHRA